MNAFIVKLPVLGSNKLCMIDARSIADVTNVSRENFGIGWTVRTTRGINFDTTPNGYEIIEEKFYELRAQHGLRDLVLIQVNGLDSLGRATYVHFVCKNAVRRLWFIPAIVPTGHGKRRVYVNGIGPVEMSRYAASQLR